MDLSKAKVNKRIPKNRFNFELYSVEQIIWLYKISYDTVGIKDNEEYKEYQIFEVEFKEKVAKEILIKIQAVIPYPILFKVKCCGIVSYVFTHSKVALETTDCLLESDTLNIEASSIAKLVYNTIVTLAKVARKQEESLDNYIVRYQLIKKLTKDLQSLKRQVDSEKQPKKRMELNEKLNKIIKELGIIE